MDFLSVCSGFGGAELAWGPLGWICRGVAEIDPAAKAVLKHRWPDVKNYGDFTKIGADDARKGKTGSVDVVVGGTPCQSFSFAGLRGGLGDERGNLALEFLRLIDQKRPRWVVWENVPGVFSSTSHVAPDPRPPAIDLESGDGPRDGEEVVVEDEYDADEDHAFACFLAGLSELGYQYAYRTLDAQHFGVPQRRRRVFVVGYLGDWRRPAAVLFERHCLSGHPPPGREKGQAVAGPVNASTPSRRNGGSNPTADQFVEESTGWGGNNTSGPIEVATACNAHGGPAGRLDFESETFVTQTVATLDASYGKLQGCSGQDALHQHSHLVPEVTHSLRADGFDASEDGTGRGTPLVPVAFRAAGQDGFTPSEISPPIVGTDGGGAGVPTIAFSCKDSGLDCGELSPTLRGMGHDSSHANAGGQVAIAFDTTQITSPGNYSNPKPGDPCHPLAAEAHVPAIAIQERAVSENSDAGPDGVGVRTDDTAYTVEARKVPQAVAFNLRGREGGSMAEMAEMAEMASVRSASGGSSRTYVAPLADTVREMGGPAIGSMAVRRLTPTECERLQGLPDGHTQVPYRGKPMADGPRYKLCGNGFAIPVVKWIGERIQQVDTLPLSDQKLPSPSEPEKQPPFQESDAP